MKPARPSALLLAVFLAQAGYSIYAGGDSWEASVGANRFLSLGIPAFLLLMTTGIDGAVRAFQQRVRRPAVSGAPAFAAALAFTLLSLNSFSGSESLARWLLVKRDFFVNDNRTALQMALNVKETTTARARMAVVWSGVTPYFADRYAIDLLGKNDPKIAREPCRFPATHERLEQSGIRLPPYLFRLIAFYPGHQKWDYAYSIGSLKPDVIVQLYRSPEEAAPYLKDYVLVTRNGVPMYYLRSSPNVTAGR